MLNLDTGGGDSEREQAAGRACGEPRAIAIHTVAFVNREALSDAALIALACDELVMHPDATLGGPGEGKNLHDDDLAVVRASLQEMFGRLGRDWSLPLALIDPDIEVHRYTQSADGRSALSCQPRRRATVANIDEWQDNGPVATADGLDAAQAEALGLARSTARQSSTS